MSAGAALAYAWRVGRYTATLTAPLDACGSVISPAIAWSPHVPGALTADEAAQYRAGRDEALASLAVALRAQRAEVAR